MIHLTVVAATWWLLDKAGLRLERGRLSCGVALIAWGLGLILMGKYRAGTSAHRSRLLVDHLLISTVWVVGCWMGGARLNPIPAVYFVVAVFAGLSTASWSTVAQWPGLLVPKLNTMLARVANRFRRLREIGKSFHVKLVPLTFFAGVLGALGAMSVFGWWATREHFHQEFARITPWMAPSTNYYPTASELANIVRQKTRPGTVLVIVGGNSVFYGVGQPPGRVWTDSLERELGGNYSVVNLALPGAAPVDGGAVVAEILRKEFPQQIYLANTWACDASATRGNPAYRYIFWDAYYGNQLIDDPLRNASVEWIFAQQAPHEGFVELRSRVFLDKIFHFQDGWNYVAYKKVGTVWGNYSFGKIGIKPREMFPDQEGDFIALPVARRFSGVYDAPELALIRKRNAWAFESGSDQSELAVNSKNWDEFGQNIDGMFPRALRKQTLIVISRDCPYFTEKLSPADRERNDLAYLLTLRKWREYGYESMDYGSDFPVEDYGDRIHLTSLGGEKLAKVIAVKVREMSDRLGYLKNR